MFYYNDDDISENLNKYGEHEWNCERFKILGKIRQDSIDYAKKLNADYFVVDCDNFITKNTLEEMYKLRELGVIAPMLRTDSSYSNYHCDVDENGYYKNHSEYLTLLNRVKKGVYTVKVVHCVYFIHNRYLNDICYDDNSYRYEYVIFSDHLRKKQIEQYLDNREDYGIISFSSSIKSSIKSVRGDSVLYDSSLYLTSAKVPSIRINFLNLGILIEEISKLSP